MIATRILDALNSSPDWSLVVCVRNAVTKHIQKIIDSVRNQSSGAIVPRSHNAKFFYSGFRRFVLYLPHNRLLRRKYWGRRVSLLELAPINVRHGIREFVRKIIQSPKIFLQFDVR